MALLDKLSLLVLCIGRFLFIQVKSSFIQTTFDTNAEGFTRS